VNTDTRDTRDTRALYESMRTEELLRLQAAHELDRARPGAGADTITFTTSRLELIAAVLNTRPDARRHP
jgi:hypothetical protein